LLVLRAILIEEQARLHLRGGEDMKITDVDIFPLRLPFRMEFKIARGSVGSPGAGAPHIYVRVRADNGAVGWGEARPSHRWSYETEESVLSALRGYLAPLLIGRDPADREGIHRAMDTDIAPGTTVGQPIAKCALDIALHDLLGQVCGVNVQDLFGSKAAQEIRLSWIVSDPTPEGAARIASEAVAGGYGSLKVKIGISPERDVETLESVREAAPEAYIWADANQAYTPSFAQRIARASAEIGVDVLEQPLPANDLPGLRRLVASSEVPIAVDESVWSPADLVQAIRMEALDMLVIKVSKMAGLHRARQCIEICRAAGVGVLGSGLTESALGFTASAQLYAACGVQVADLNGPGQFLADGPANDQVRIAAGRAHLPTGPGLGLRIAEEDVRRFVKE